MDDVLLDVADLGGDNRPAVQAGLERGHDAITLEVAGAPLVNALAHEEDAAQAVPLAQAAIDRPRHHRLVADVLVDLAAGLQHGLGDVVEEIVLEVVEAQRPQPLGDRRRVREVEEHEDAVLGDGAMIAAQQEVHQRARPQHPVELPHDVDDEADQREDHQRQHEAAAAHEVAILPGAEVTQHAAVLGQPLQGHRHGVNGDGAEGDVEEGAHEEQSAHRQAPHQPRQEAKLEPGAAEAHDGAGGGGRELAREMRGHAPHDPVHQQRRSDPAARDPERGSRRVQGSSRDHGWHEC